MARPGQGPLTEDADQLPAAGRVRRLGERRAREFTWSGCARDTLLAYQAARDMGDEEPSMQRLFT